VPDRPELPEFPGIPNLPKPNLPNLPKPELPDLPRPDLPSLPEIPGLPELPEGSPTAPPEVVTPVGQPVASGGGGSSDELAFTGSDLGSTALLGLVILAAGVPLVALGRRRGVEG